MWCGRSAGGVWAVGRQAQKEGGAIGARLPVGDRSGGKEGWAAWTAHTA